MREMGRLGRKGVKMNDREVGKSASLNELGMKRRKGEKVWFGDCVHP